MTTDHTDNNELAPQLEPCKFCKRESKIEEFFIDNDPQPWYVATCSVCPIKTYDQTTPEEAARIWNTAPVAGATPTVKHHKLCAVWTVTTCGDANPCNCVCECAHSMGEHLRRGQDSWFEECAHSGCECAKFAATATAAAPAEQSSYNEGFEDAARVSRVLNSVVADSSQPARDAAQEIVQRVYGGDKDEFGEPEAIVAAIISKHFPAAAAPVGPQYQNLLDAARERVTAIREYRNDPAVTSMRCGKADEWLQAAVEAIDKAATVAATGADEGEHRGIVAEGDELFNEALKWAADFFHSIDSAGCSRKECELAREVAKVLVPTEVVSGREEYKWRQRVRKLLRDAAALRTPVEEESK